MAIDKKLRIFDDEGNLVDYDILASDVKFNDGKDLPTKLDEMDEAIEDAAKSGGDVDLSDYYTKTDSDGRYVQKVNGKGLSTNDFTDADKDKLQNLPTNPVQSITVNGQAQQKDQNGNVNIEVSAGVDPATASPAMDGTAAVGISTKYAREDHVHPHDTTKADKATTYTKSEVDDAIDDKLTDVVVNEISGAADIITIDDADLAFIDEDGNIAMRVAEGHVETADFDSRQVGTNTTAIQQLQSQVSNIGNNVQTDVVVKEDPNAVFDIADANGNVAFRITSKGHIKTKGFDSENMDVFRETKLASPQCICHGVGAASGIENTIPYFRDGIAKGFKFFECDGQDLADGVTICFHNTKNIKNKTTGEVVSIGSSDVLLAMTSTELLPNYTWSDGTPIATLKDVIWFICYFHRFPLHVDVKPTMTSQSCYDAAEYAESLGVGKYVFFEGGHYELFGNLPQNRLMMAATSQIPALAARYKKPNNNIIFIYSGAPTSATDEQFAAFAKAAHDAGCYTEVYTYSNIENIRRAFRCGIDFIITNGKTNNDV